MTWKLSMLTNYINITRSLEQAPVPNIKPIM